MRKRPRNGKFTKTDLALVIQEVLDIPLDKVSNDPTVGRKIMNAFLTALTDALNRGEDVTVKGFGKFTVRKPRERWNVPRPAKFNPGKFGHDNTSYSEEQEWYPAKKRVYFKPSVQLTAMLNVDNPNEHEKSKAISKW